MMSTKSINSIPLKSVLKTVFKYEDRGYKNSIVLIPGWASDFRIFNSLDIKFNYLKPVNFYPLTFKNDLLVFLRENSMKNVSLFGWSMGGFLAAEFASRYPELIDELILIGIRKKYESAGLEKIKEHLKKNRKAYLFKFYNDCFYKKEDMRWFRENLLKLYCSELNLSYLVETLDYLGGAELKSESLSGIRNVTILHGKDDRIAPFAEAAAIKNGLPSAKFICFGETGHIPFLKNDFANLL